MTTKSDHIGPTFKRAVIYPKDVETITGKRPTAARNLLSAIRKTYAKEKKQFVTFREFCQYTGIADEEIRRLLK